MENAKRKTLKMSLEDQASKSVKELTISSDFADGLDFGELLSAFKQFLIVLGYSEYTAKSVVALDSEEIDKLNLSEEDLRLN